MRFYPDDDFFIDANGCPTERVLKGGLEVIVHYDDVPEKDLTTVRGIPCTTALRTMIDIAPTTEPDEFRRMVDDCLRRRLFTVDEALARCGELDMLRRPGAHLLRKLLLSR